jgi:hypothetical protein
MTGISAPKAVHGCHFIYKKSRQDVNVMAGFF